MVATLELHFDFHRRAIVFCERAPVGRCGLPGRDPHRRPVTFDVRGRPAVSVPKAWRRFANGSRWQWLARLVVMLELGRRLRPDEHVHHTNGDRRGTRLDRLEVVLAEYHGQVHATAATLAGWRDAEGRFVEWRRPGRTVDADRAGPIIGPAARELLDAWAEDR